MQIIESAQASFRYNWSWRRTGRPPSHLAATKVAVLHLEPDETVAQTQKAMMTLAGHSRLQGAAGVLEMDEFGFTGSARLSRLLLHTLHEAGIPEFKHSDGLEPMLAIARDGTYYHVDMPWHMMMFGAWCLTGPERIVRFPLLDIEVPFRPGTVLLFDHAQPHALLRPGHTEFDPQACPDPENVTFISFQCWKDGALADLLGAELYEPRRHAELRHTVPQYKPCPRTGRIQFLNPEKEASHAAC